MALAGAWAGGGLLLCSEPLTVADADADPFALLDSSPIGSIGNVPNVGVAIGGGWFGWLGFQLAARAEPVPPPPPQPVPELAPFALGFYDHLVRCDERGDWWFEALSSPARADHLEGRLAIWRERLGSAPPPPVAIDPVVLAPAGSGLTGHRRAIAETVARIAAGDMSQANICMRLEAEFHGDPLELWLQAIARSSPAYAAFVGAGDDGHAVVSLSPELFLKRSGRRVETRPIKGTLPLDQDPTLLATSAKDRAENVMIVDLMRNDLGRVSAYGSVGVDALCEVRAAPGVWHLESTVSGLLRDGIGDAELLSATFPPGSVTGAPKVQALRTIHQLEASAREAYCGAIGFRSPIAGLELNVAIRTLEFTPGRVWLGVGGGIVADSNPVAEVEEALAKAHGALSPTGLESAPPGGAWKSPASGPATAVVRTPRPDPRRGLIETMLVTGGMVRFIDRHLARLRTSCAALGFDTPDDRLELELNALARPLGDGAIRVFTDGARLELTTRSAPGAATVQLEAVAVAGGLGIHKWADRDLVDSLSGPGRTPLICDLDDAVLEAGYAAVMAVTGDTLVAPPLDGRQLPSLSRAQTLTAAADAGFTVVTAELKLADLDAVDAIVLSSSLRGPHLGVIGGTTPSASGEQVCARLQAGWRELLMRCG